jgi:4'-phosphopantetheinyl transferase
VLVEFHPWSDSESLPPLLAANQVHLWHTDLDADQARVDELTRVLAEEEQERAARFRFSRHRRRFTVCRAVLRCLLGAYLESEPAELRFVYGAKGKPRLADQENFHFNLSHSADLALYGVARHELGVDVEELRDMKDPQRIAQRFFSPYEREALRLVPPYLQREAFLNCWTRKEAYIKAIGEGVPAALQDFDVSIKPGEPARIINIEGEPGGAAAWFLQELRPTAGYVGTLAIRAHDLEISAWRWPE